MSGGGIGMWGMLDCQTQGQAVRHCHFLIVTQQSHVLISEEKLHFCWCNNKTKPSNQLSWTFNTVFSFNLADHKHLNRKLEEWQIRVELCSGTCKWREGGKRGAHAQRRMVHLEKVLKGVTFKFIIIFIGNNKLCIINTVNSISSTFMWQKTFNKNGFHVKAFLFLNL